MQGGGEGAHDEWDNKLVESLRRELGAGYEIFYPRMPDESEPHYAAWSGAISDALAKLDDGAVAVGHSLGAAILVATLAERQVTKLAGVFLAACPFIGPGGWPSDEIAPMTNLGSRLPKALPVHLYHGDADETAPVDHLALYEKALPQAKTRTLKGRDHQLGNDLSEVARDIRMMVAASK